MDIIKFCFVFVRLKKLAYEQVLVELMLHQLYFCESCCDEKYRPKVWGCFFHNPDFYQLCFRHESTFFWQG